MAATVQFNNISKKDSVVVENKEESISLSKRLMELIPRELRMVNNSQGLQKFLLTISMMLVGCLILYFSPWWLMPLGWLFLGTVATGLQAIGYDTASGVFSKSPIVNEVIGHIVTLPLLVPFASWKTQLNGQEYEKLFAKLAQSQFWFFSSLVHWIKSAFVWGRAFRQNRLRVVSSVTFLYAATVLSFGTAFYFGGAWTVAKYWFAPWCVYHFWMTTFITTSYKQREGKTEKVMVVHVRYPQWVELLTHKMNYIMSAHRSSLRVPSDNIEKSYIALRAKLDNFMEELSFRSDFWNTVCTSASWWLNIAKNFNGISAAWILITPVLALYGVLTTEIQAATFRVAVFWYFWAGLGITVGYHRYLAHRSFDAHPIIRWILLLGGTAAFEGSAIWWCRDHRAHHRFSDTPKDPYGVDRGFFWAHMGWLLLKQDKAKVGKTDCSDLENDPILQFQEKYYFKLAFLFGLVLPVLVCGLLFGDWRGGFFIAGMARIVFVMQSTFCINSLAHYVGEQTFSDYRSSRDNFWVSLVTFGEGYHNFHHEFPYDYRNGMVWYAYDPSKWSIWLLSLFGLTYNLKRFPRAEIEKGVIQMQQKRLDQLKARYNWGPEIESLPEYTWQQVRELVREGAALVVYKGLVHDVADFMKIHPGGEKMISCRLGTDITESFNGGVYNHANGARHLLDMFRVGRVKQACDTDSQESSSSEKSIVEDQTLTPRLTRPIPTKQLEESLKALETKTSKSE